jgi:hypothetical protein
MDVIGDLISSYGNTGMLNRTVRVEKSSAHHACGGMVLQFLGQCLQPTGMNFRVVVQEDDRITSGQQGPLVARPGESEVLVVSPAPDISSKLGEKFLRAVAARVVYHQHLIEPFSCVRVFGNGTEALKGVFRLVVHRDDDTDFVGRTGGLGSSSHRQVEFRIRAMALFDLVTVRDVPMDVPRLVEEGYFLEPVPHDAGEVFAGQIPNMIRVDS